MCMAAMHSSRWLYILYWVQIDPGSCDGRCIFGREHATTWCITGGRAAAVAVWYFTAL